MDFKVVKTPSTGNDRNSGEGFAARIWHRGAQKYLYASDYGLDAFPIRTRSNQRQNRIGLPRSMQRCSGTTARR
jgi:hypothetical protein